MRIVTGKVVAGRVVVEGEPLEEGSTVTVLAPERNEAFALASEAEASLAAAIAEGDRDEVITGEQLLDKLRGKAAKANGRTRMSRPPGNQSSMINRK